MKPKTIAINLLSYVSILLTSCYPYGTEVERALRYAANNRGELEKVLTHYSQDEADSLKLRAACYLIKHMPHHTSYPAEPYAEYCKEMHLRLRQIHRERRYIISVKIVPQM